MKRTAQCVTFFKKGNPIPGCWRLGRDPKRLERLGFRLLYVKNAIQNV